MAQQLVEEFNDGYENQAINEEYKIWKKNAPFLYDVLITHELEWPSLTVQWLPTKDIPQESDYAIHKLLLSTHTSGQEKDFLLIAKVRLPLEETTSEVPESQGVQIKEIGQSAGDNRIEIETKILHEGESNRSRYMPQKYNVIASKLNNGEIHVFDYTQHPTQPVGDQVKPQLRLTGHTQEGYGLSWNPNKQGYILSGGYDKKICIWNVEAASQLNTAMNPYTEINFHKSGVEDVAWHQINSDIFGSVSDDKTVAIWDLRQRNTAGIINPVHCTQAHKGEIYCIDFNPFNEYLFITGSEDKTVAFWDIRNTTKRLHTFEGHTDQVLRVEWSPFNIGVFASASSDRRVIVWDISRCGQEIKGEDLQDGAAELMFMHGGHRAKVNDFSWNTKDHLVIASVEENNILQVWQMARNIYDDNEDDNNQQNNKN
ncbi:retinoblastoma-binding protein, putative [Ichthyophthirius multifiliis]|uniref:Retinoblastoma-binding protein, putative n=1 Tax=Ichthyophthirius multifiliis TaxID=5932 RepID=G0QV38_ICHMU|nr:retinoblastoma-binding protein, putative [Ichthyophthirius multifiliis]EGR30912.1 retinoblastoma-binding protein, putative [Ichthyophthirius multifiliis]|eukprot:XP_004032499.1 retinoblastoma-binding protein, putative [Ichthyophthirius multifiliis]